MRRSIAYRNVPLRERPEDSSPQIAALARDELVEINQTRDDLGWVEVTTEAGFNGWVKNIELGPPLEEKAVVEEVEPLEEAPPPPIRVAAEGFKICPFCAEEIRVDAIKCRFCGSDTNASSQTVVVASTPSPPSQTRRPLPPLTPMDAPTRTRRDYDDLRHAAAATRSYTTPAVITLVLYFVLWLPGLIANIAYLSAASNDQRLAGTAPEGKGCLTALLWWFAIIPFILVVILIAVGAIAVA